MGTGKTHERGVEKVERGIKVVRRERWKGERAYEERQRGKDGSQRERKKQQKRGA